MHRAAFHGSTLDVEFEFVPTAAADANSNLRRKCDDRDQGPQHMQAFQEEMDDPSSNCRILVEDLDERLPDTEILNKFKQYGAIETFDVIRDRGRLTSVIIRFRSLSSAVRARREMNGQPLGDRRCRVEYRFADASPELWVGGVHASVTEADVNREFSRFGRLCKVQINRANKCAFVMFDRVEDAVQAAANMRGRVLGSAAWKLKVDFADRSQTRAHSPVPGRQLGRFKSGAARPGAGDAGGAGHLVRHQAPGPESEGDAEGSRGHHPQHHFQQQQNCPAIQEGKASATESQAAKQPSVHSVAGGYRADEAASASHSTVGVKRQREVDAAGMHGSHAEKKSLSIIVDSSSAPSDTKTNGHCSLDCLTARPGSTGEADLCPTPVAHSESLAEPVDEAAAVDPLERFPELWRGQAVVKGAAAGVVLRSVKCEDRLARDMLVGERVTMTQRMRLGEDQMKEFGLRLQSRDESSRGVLLAVPASAEDGPRLRQHFVTYLLDRNAAGVARLDTGMLYLFPPGSELASEYQKSAAIDLSHHPDYLLVILLQDGL